MDSPSQSRHFNLHWLDRPQAWLNKLEMLTPQDSKAAWRWHVSHHQLLTLAKRSERESGLSILWFSVSEENNLALVGALLPGDRLTLIPPAPTSARGPLSDDEIDSLHQFLRSRLKVHSVMGTEPELNEFGFLIQDEVTESPHHILERQTPWGKRLTNVASTNSGLHRRSALTTTRRAIETDRPLLNRWARLFAAETQAEAIETSVEVSEWVRRARLLIFETDRPVGMAALSGEFTDPDFGRSCRLSLIFIDPVQRGRGLGHEMIHAIESEARLENANALVLYSDPGNERARRFYSDLGFSPSDDWLELPASAAGLSVKTTG